MQAISSDSNGYAADKNIPPDAILCELNSQTSSLALCQTDTCHLGHLHSAVTSRQEKIIPISKPCCPVNFHLLKHCVITAPQILRA